MIREGVRGRQRRRQTKPETNKTRDEFRLYFGFSDIGFCVPGGFLPILCTRSMACSSIAGFHHKSNIMTLDADVKFSPTEPDLRETRRTGMGVVRKAVNIVSR